MKNLKSETDLSFSLKIEGISKRWDQRSRRGYFAHVSQAINEHVRGGPGSSFKKATIFGGFIPTPEDEDGEATASLISSSTGTAVHSCQWKVPWHATLAGPLPTGTSDAADVVEVGLIVAQHIASVKGDDPGGFGLPLEGR